MDCIGTGCLVKLRGTGGAGFSQHTLSIRAELNLHAGNRGPILISHKDNVGSLAFSGGGLRINDFDTIGDPQLIGGDQIGGGYLITGGCVIAGGNLAALGGLIAGGRQIAGGCLPAGGCVITGGCLAAVGGLITGRCLLIEYIEHFRGDGTLAVVNHHTVPVQDDCLRYGRGSVDDTPYPVILCVQGKGNAVTLISEIGFRFVRHDRGVDCQHGNIIPMFAVEGVKVRQLLHTGCAVCCPEVDEGHFAPCLREGKG